TVSLVDPEALSPLTKHGSARALPAYDEGRAWPPVGAPIIEALAPRTVPWDGAGMATALRVPWDGEDRDSSAEAACLPADLCVGPPVAYGLAGEGVAHPNPDLSLRFAGPLGGREVIGVGRLER